MMMFSVWIVIVGSLLTLALDQNVVARAVQLLEHGEGNWVIACRFDVSPNVISRLWRRYQETWQYNRRQDQGRMTTPRQDHYLVNLSCQNRRRTAWSLENDFHHAAGVHLSNQAVRNWLHDGVWELDSLSQALFLLQNTVKHDWALHVNTRTGNFVTGGQLSSQTRAG